MPEENQHLSDAARHPVPSWQRRLDPKARLFLAEQCARLLERNLEKGRAERVAFLIDTREAHRELFERLTPAGFEVYAGNYRGTPDTPLHNRHSVIRYGRHRGVRRVERLVKPHKVATAMDDLATHIIATFEKPRSEVEAFWRIVQIFNDFSQIHPYLDGNGHIARLMMHVMADTAGISVNPNWTIHARPYDAAIGLCLQNYQKHPDLLCFYLRKWFGKWSGA